MTHAACECLGRPRMMLREINDIYGNSLVATDGKIGHVKDFYFDDESWIVRYLVVDTGSWLSGRQVLLSPQAFDGFGKIGDMLPVFPQQAARDNLPKETDDSLDHAHPQSTRSVTEYDIKASDGLLGCVCGFLVDHKSWAIADLVVESGPWYSGKNILISPSAVKRISYAKSKMLVKPTRATRQRTLEDEVAKPAFCLC